MRLSKQHHSQRVSDAMLLLLISAEMLDTLACIPQSATRVHVYHRESAQLLWAVLTSTPGPEQ